MFEFFLVHGFSQICQSSNSIHHDRTASCLHFSQHQVVTQTGRGNCGSTVRSVLRQFFLGSGATCKIFTQTIEGLGFEQQEPCTNRAVTVFKTGRGETVFHHGKFSTDLHGHGIGGTSIPYRIPCAAFAFTN